MKRLLGAMLALSAFAACVDETGGSTGGGAVPSSAEQACLAAVSRTTNNGDVAVISSSFSQAGTQVIVGVGPQRAQWSCIAYSDGSTDGITSLTDEGSL